MRKITIAKDFSDVPLGRYISDGPYSGERFREEFLKPALETGEGVIINLDGAEGYGSSFLDEAFGGLVREKYFNADQLKKELQFECVDPDNKIYEPLIWRYIDEAQSNL